VDVPNAVPATILLFSGGRERAQRVTRPSACNGASVNSPNRHAVDLELPAVTNQRPHRGGEPKVSTPSYGLISTHTDLMPPVHPKERRFAHDHARVARPIEISVGRKLSSLPHDVANCGDNQLQARRPIRKLEALGNGK